MIFINGRKGKRVVNQKRHKCFKFADILMTLLCPFYIFLNCPEYSISLCPIVRSLTGQTNHQHLWLYECQRQLRYFLSFGTLTHWVSANQRQCLFTRNFSQCNPYQIEMVNPISAGHLPPDSSAFRRYGHEQAHLQPSISLLYCVSIQFKLWLN